MKVAIGADHGGYELKKETIKFMEEKGITVIDCGTDSNDACDFSDFSDRVTASVTSGEADCGILICGTGIGMSIAANKKKGIRAALVGDVFSAKATREHNDTNVLCLGARVTGPGLALMIVDTWLHTDFLGGKYQRRLDKIDD